MIFTRVYIYTGCTFYRWQVAAVVTGCTVSVSDECYNHCSLQPCLYQSNQWLFFVHLNYECFMAYKYIRVSWEVILCENKAPSLRRLLHFQVFLSGHEVLSQTAFYGLDGWDSVTGAGFFFGFELQTGLGAQIIGVLSLQIGRFERETDTSLSSSEEVNMSWRYISTPLYAYVT